MSEVICPYCGTSNPPDVERCKSCNKPLFERPDWLNDLRSFAATDSGNQKPPHQRKDNPPENPAEEEVPDWLARIRKRTMERSEDEEARARQSAETSKTSAEPSQGHAEEIPDWLFPEEKPSEPAVPAAEEPFTADWMSDLRGKEIPTEEQLPEEAGGKPAPDWSEFAAGTGIPQPAGKPEDQPGGGDIALPPLPPAFQVPAEQEEAGLAGLEPSAGITESPEPEQFDAEFPEWPAESILGTDSEKAGMELSDQAGPIESSPEEKAGIPEEPAFAAFEEMDLSTAFTEEPTVDTNSESEPSGNEGEKEIEEAELPGWLEAMKPVESVAPARFEAEADQQVEENGPLAGFQGILPGSHLATSYSKPPIYPVRLNVTEKQRIYSNLLENMVAEESRAAPAVTVKAAAPSALLRLLVGVILAGLLVFVMVTGLQVGAMPTLFAPETVSFFDEIQQLNSLGSARLLVAVEYEPGLSGELTSISKYPIQQLLSTGSTLALISTVPEGPAMGEVLIGAAAQSVSEYNPDAQIINLGYLVGGSTSLASLAVQPSLAAHSTINGDPAWDTPQLQGIQTVADFDGLLLLTDNPETARAWFEQVQPALGGKPLLVISSAQSAPMILPFYQSRQIQGLLAGLNGQASYDQLNQAAVAPTRAYWDAYQAGILLIVLAIVLGAAFYGVRELIRRQFSGKRK